jgi:hypothetical protein
MAYDINYEDERFVDVKNEEAADIKESDAMYDGMINASNKFYDEQINAVKDWGNTQAQLQQEQTDFTVDKIEQQKDQAHKDYVKEQSGAYVDWQKQSNQYGANAEQMAANGLTNSGYSESSQVAMYNQYQNRVAVAKASFDKAVIDYDNMMKEAYLENSAAKAEIAFNTLQITLELGLQGFQYNNQLVLAKADAKANIKDRSYNKYQNVLNQINSENALAEQIRQYNESLAEEKRQYNENLAFQKEQFEEEKRQFNASLSARGSSGSGSSGNDVLGQLDDDKKGDVIPTFTTYEDAAAYMKEQGVATGDGGLMTKREWQRRKAGGSNATETKYSSYSEYLNHFVAWRMENPQE